MSPASLLFLIQLQIIVTYRRNRLKSYYSLKEINFNVRIAFKIAITETPTSANTASHILATPNAPRSSTSAFIKSAKTIFCFTILKVFLEIFTTCAIFLTSSSIRTTSAASIAASEPILPIAIPTSTLVSTGASLIPSPAKASFSLPF